MPPMTPTTESAKTREDRLAEALLEARNDLNETAGSNSGQIARFDRLLAEYDRARSESAYMQQDDDDCGPSMQELASGESRLGYRYRPAQPGAGVGEVNLNAALEAYFTVVGEAADAAGLEAALSASTNAMYDVIADAMMVLRMVDENARLTDGERGITAWNETFVQQEIRRVLAGKVYIPPATPPPSAERAPVAWVPLAKLLREVAAYAPKTAMYDDRFTVHQIVAVALKAYSAPPPDAGTAAPVVVTDAMVSEAMMAYQATLGQQPGGIIFGDSSRCMRAALEAALLTSRAPGET